MTGIRFEVDHVDHTGALISTHTPVGSTLRWTNRNQDYGLLQYEVAYSDPEVTTDGWAAKRTDVELWLVTEPDQNRYLVWAGLHDAANLRLTDRGTIFVSARDWLWWTDQPYPFPAYEAETLDSLIATNAWPGLLYNAIDGDTIEDVIVALLDPITDGTAEQVDLVPDFQGPAFAEPIYWRVDFTDSQTILGHLRALASLADPQGFDFFCDVDKLVRFSGPRLQDPATASPIFSFTSPDNGIVEIDWTNFGPAAINTVAVASGAGNARRWSRKTYAPSEALYRDWTIVRPITRYTQSLTDEDGIGYFAEGGGYLDRHPQKRLFMTIKPDIVDPSDPTAMFFNQIAQVIDVDYQFPVYHRVDANFYIVAQEFFGDGAGNYFCHLSLDQIYT